MTRIKAILSDELRVRPAQSLPERCAAWHLVYQKYLDSGFIPSHPSAMQFSLLDLLPQSVSWTAHHNERLIGTMSTVMFSTAGLPCGLTYESELLDYGIDGRLVCEFTKLATEDSDAKAEVAFRLVGSMIYWCWQTHVDDLVCVVHPRHARTWKSIFGWNPIGEVRMHKGVNGNPGVLMHIDLKRYHENLHQMPSRGRNILRRVGEIAPPDRNLFRLSSCETAALLLQRPELLLECSPAQRASLGTHYPWASRVVSPLLQAALGRFGVEAQIPAQMPARDRTLTGFSETDELSGNQGGLPSRPGDPLLYRDGPIVLVIEDLRQTRSSVWSSIESQAVTIIHASSFAEAQQLANEYLFDMVLFGASADEPEFGEFSTMLRARDAFLQIHTPILPVRVLFRLQSGEYPLQDDWIHERQCAADLVRVLELIFRRVWPEQQAGSEQLLVEMTEGDAKRA